MNLGGKQKAFNLTQRGLCYRELNENKKAEADYQEALRLQPDETLAYIGLGNIYNEAGDYDRAIGIYEKGLAAAKEEDKGMILNNLGFTYKEKGDYTKALEILTEGIQKYPNHAETWRSRAQTFDAMGQPEKGIPHMDEFLKRKPGDARSYRFRATLYEKTGKKDLAEKDREKAEALEKGRKQP
ncbi:tetratricopeptide repeat protein [uncultured Dialister sp.]|uniref:tetratricopeptide repeat protein n=1 Tax=uncultured Dialister sp. TaxID=278064 RepID=UPI00344CE448